MIYASILFLGRDYQRLVELSKRVPKEVITPTVMLGRDLLRRKDSPENWIPHGCYELIVIDYDFLSMADEKRRQEIKLALDRVCSDFGIAVIIISKRIAAVPPRKGKSPPWYLACKRGEIRKAFLKYAVWFSRELKIKS